MRRKSSKLIVAASFIAASTWVPHAADAGPSGGALPPRFELEVYIADDDLVPYDALAVALNVTVVNPASDGFLTVYPCGETKPNTSNLNYRANQTVPNAVISRLSVDGSVCVATSAPTDVLVDVAGFFPATSPLIPLTNPERVLDTRSGIGAPAARVAAGDTLQFHVGGVLSTPADASATVINITAVNASTTGYATVYPCGQPLPNASNLNFAAGQTVPGLVIARLGAGGTVCVKTTATIDLLADVSGYFPSGAIGYTPIDNPERVLDTRSGIGAPVGAPPANADLSFQIVDRAGVPSTATAVVLNVTATQATDAGFTTVYGCGSSFPTTSSLNFAAKTDVPNLVIAKIGAGGRVCARSSATVGLIADVAGYFTGGDAYVPLDSPYRVYDTRPDGDLWCNLAVSHMVDHSVTVTDLLTGSQRAVVTSPFMVEPTVPVQSALLEDCSGFIAVVPSAYAGLVDFVEFKFNGRATFLWQGRPRPSKLTVIDDGTALAMDSTQITDVRSHEVLLDYGSVLLPGVLPFSSVFPVDVTGDGVAVLQTSGRNGELYGDLNYYDLYDGSLIGTGPSPRRDGHGSQPLISRYGTYMSTLTGSMYASQVSIEFSDGQPVTTSSFTLASGGSVTSFDEWISDSTMLICDGPSNTAVYRWDIYSTPIFLYNNGSCPAAAG